MSTLEEIRTISEKVIDLQNQLKTNINSSKSTTVFPVPSVDKATGDQTLEQYLSQYMVTLRQEESRFKDQYKTYKDELYEGLSELYHAPAGTAFSEQAIKYAEQIEKGDTSVRDAVTDFEKRLQTRHSTINEAADANQLSQYGEYAYKIRDAAPAKQWIKESHAVTQVNGQKKNILNNRHMDLPTFYGDIAEWPAFYLLFNRHIVILSYRLHRLHLACCQPTAVYTP